ncbi:MAG TPA: hypothetical protein VF456_29645, partial [Vicinamibacterales bacterium]
MKCVRLQTLIDVSLITIFLFAFHTRLFAQATSILSAQRVEDAVSTCAVTVPNGVVAGSSVRDQSSYGNAALSVGP